MKKWKKLLVSLLTVSMTIGTASVSVMAAEPYTYKVTLSAGNKGTINGENKIEQTGIASGSTVTFNLDDIQVTDDKYYVKGIRLSGRDNDEALSAPSFTIDGDADYVVAYGIKGDMVAYTVNYRDASGNALTESKTYYGNVGDKPVVAYRYIDNYIPDALALTKTLSDNESENVFTFTYTPGATDRIVETTTVVTTTVPGTATTTTTGTTGTTDTTGTTGTAGTTGTTGTAGTTTTDGAAAGTTGGTTGTTTDAAGTTSDANASGDTTGETTTAPDEETPQSIVDLDDEETPKSNIDLKNKTSKTPLAAMIAIIVVAVAALAGLVAFMIYLKKKTK